MNNEISTVRLHMSKQLLEELFPEGSEARIELTRSVAVELVKRLSIKEVKLLDDSVIAQVARVAEEEHKKGLAELGIVRGMYNYSLNSEVASMLRSLVGQAVSAQVYKYAEEQGATLKEAASGVIEHTAKRLLQGDLNNIIDQRIKTMLKGLA